MTTKCLIVKNNFEGVNIQPTIEFPLILRQLDVALGFSKLFNPTNEKETLWEAGTVWIPQQMASRLNGNFSKVLPKGSVSFDWRHSCPFLKYIYSLWPIEVTSSSCFS